MMPKRFDGEVKDCYLHPSVGERLLDCCRQIFRVAGDEIHWFNGALISSAGGKFAFSTFVFIPAPVLTL